MVIEFNLKQVLDKNLQRFTIILNK